MTRDDWRYFWRKYRASEEMPIINRSTILIFIKIQVIFFTSILVLCYRYFYNKDNLIFHNLVKMSKVNKVRVSGEVAEGTGRNQHILLNRLITKIRNSLDLKEILHTTAKEIRTLLKIDRVKIYRFEADGSGEVIAESIKGKVLPSLKGLHFPAEDVPNHVRERLMKDRQRIIIDVKAGLKITNDLEDSQLNTSNTEELHYSRVDPCHAEYLTNMGVSSSFVVPILHHQSLWGLLSCHHSQPKQYVEKDVNMVQLLVDQLSIAIAQAELFRQAKQQATEEAIINHISYLLHTRNNSPKQVRQIVLAEMVTALQADGGRMYIIGETSGEPSLIYTHGVQPHIVGLERSPLWQNIISKKQDEIQVYYTNNIETESKLASLLSNFQETEIRSLLIIPLHYQQQCLGCLTFFRKQLETFTLWAGHHNQDERNNRPRQSFAVWQEIKQGETLPWTPQEIKLGKALSLHLYLAVLQQRIEAMLKHQASHDLLTGLANRSLFQQQLSLNLIDIRQHPRTSAILFLDLDGFKHINDTFGHAIGDIFLKNVADRLQSELSTGDIIARWGGDEFTFLIPTVNDSQEANQIAQRILQSLAQPFQFEQQEFYIKASLGIALAPHDGDDPETLLKNADAAMHRAKQLGKNQYQLYTSDIGSQVYRRLLLENNLYRAINRHEFVLHYQPQIDLQTGKMMAMEALIRWHHPEKGLISPLHFIPIAEETGLIIPISEWVLEQVCLQNKLWEKQGLPIVPISVNLSARQLQEVQLVNVIADIIKKTEIAPQYLELEITETAAMEDMNLTISILQDLQALGTSIAMDDFGIGYSSLWSLKRLPLNKLKIDKSFVRDVMQDMNDVAIIRAIIAMGHELKLKVIAEGVETSDQLEFLQSVHCDGIQGFFFSRPLTVEELTDLWQKSYNYGFCPLHW